MGKAGWFVAVLAALGLLGAACSGGGGDQGAKSAEGARQIGAPERAEPGPALEPATVEEDAAVVGTTGAAGGAGQAPAPAVGLPEIGPSVIKTAELSLELARDGFRAGFQAAIDVAGEHGGYVLSTTTAGDEARSGSLVMRVPADRFEEALADLKDVAVAVTSETVRGEDVTQEFIDLEARLRNLRAQEAALLRLMDRAQTVTDTIRVQNQLTGVQLDIERIRGRLRYLQDQTSMSTISVALRERGARPPGRTSVIGEAWERALEVALSIVAAVIVGVGVAVPVALLALLVLLALRLLRLRFRPAA
jgi:hypothetical protein